MKLTGTPAPPNRATRFPRIGLGSLATLTLAFLLTGAAPAAAHDYIESSNPPAGSALSTAPTRISITLSDRPSDLANTLTVTGPDQRRYEQGPTGTAATVVSVAVTPLGPAGVYEIGYRIGSSDGHPVTGSIPFRLLTPGPAAVASLPPEGSSPPPSAAPALDSAAETRDSSADQPVIWFIVIMAVTIIGTSLIVVLRRRS